MMRSMDTVRRWCAAASLTDSIADRHRGVRGLVGHTTDGRPKKAPGLHQVSLNPLVLVYPDDPIRGWIDLNRARDTASSHRDGRPVTCEYVAMLSLWCS